MRHHDNASELVLRAGDVLARLKVSRATLWRWCREGTFPAPIRLGRNTVAWRATDVADWLTSRPSTRAAIQVDRP